MILTKVQLSYFEQLALDCAQKTNLDEKDQKGQSKPKAEENGQQYSTSPKVQQ